MDNAKNLSPIFRVSVLAVEPPWLQGAEKSGFGTGRIWDVAIAIRGGRTKRSGTANGKGSFPLIGKRLSIMPKTVSDTLQTCRPVMTGSLSSSKQEVCQLRWNWEVQVPELETSAFILPDNEQFQTKNAQERIVVLNTIARGVVDAQRGKHPEFVFTYRGKPVKSILNSGWKHARIRAGLPQVRVH